MDTKRAQRETVMEGKRRRRTFTEEFKVKAVRAIVEGGRRVTDVARELDIQGRLLLLWKKDYLEGKYMKTQDNNDRSNAIARLSKELKKARKERDRLKRLLAVVLGEVTR